MAISIRDNRIVLNEADSTTGWVSTDGPTVFTSGPTPIEAGGCLGLQASLATQNAYVPITSDNYSNGGSLFIWMTDRAAFDTTVNGGIGIQVGDGTNRIAYHVGGSDGTGFRHEVGPVKWANFQIDLANKPVNFSVLAGSEANLNEAAITQVGVYFETIAKSVGGADNCFWDIIRFADNGVGIEVYGGTSGVPETWEQVTVEDRNEGTLRAHGIIRKVGAGAYSIQGNISIGDVVGTSNTYINSVGETFLWENRNQSTNNYYRFNATGNGTGVTDINFDGCVWTCPTSASVDVSNVNVDAFDVRGTVITGFNRGINTGGSSNVWSGNTFNTCGQLVTTGSNLLENVYNNFTGSGNTAQLYWNTTTDPNGSIDNSEFNMPATLTHAIQFPTGMTNQSITITDCVFNGYNSANNQNDSTFNVLATTGTLTINIIGGSGNVSYRTAGATVNVIQNPVTTTITVTDINTNAVVVGARVLLYAFSGGSENYNESVTITNVATTATVTHTSHGLTTGDKVLISGANQIEYNGVKTITVTGGNSYTFTTSGSPTSPATGTITSTTVFIDGITDSNGQISDVRSFSSSQPVRGRVRRATSGTLYKQAPIIATINNISGLDLGVQLISDE